MLYYKQKYVSTFEENAMNISKTVLGLAAVIIAVANINSARAAEANNIKNSAILFKIHDIVPVKSNEGEVVGCDYSATFFNRSNLTIRSASLDLSWKDNAIDEVITQEKKEDSVKNNRNMGRARSVTERNTDKVIAGSLDVPTIKPVGQVTVKSRVNSDRCFLMLDNARFQVKNCNAENAQGQAANRNRGDMACGRLFKYVSAEDPQYYLEFKVVSVDEEKAEIEAARNKQMSQTDEAYKKALTAIDATNTIISGIK